MARGNLGIKGFISLKLLDHSRHQKKSGQELKQAQRQGAWRKDAHWLALHGCSTCFLRQSKTTCPGRDLPQRAGPSPHQTFIQKTSPQKVLPGKLMEAVPHFGPLFPDDGSLCQLDKTERHSDVFTFALLPVTLVCPLRTTGPFLPNQHLPLFSDPIIFLRVAT